MATPRIGRVIGNGLPRLSTDPVENSVDGLRECRPSTGSAEESYALITKSPSKKNIKYFNNLRVNTTAFRKLAAQSADPAQRPVTSRAGEVHIILAVRHVNQLFCKALFGQDDDESAGNASLRHARLC